MALQTSVNYNDNFYPFSEINPNYNWFKRLRISWLGETSREIKSRIDFKNSILENICLPTKNASITNSAPLSPVLSELSSPFKVSWPVPKSPSIGSLGLNLSGHNTLPEFVQGSFEVARTNCQFTSYTCQTFCSSTPIVYS
jgi:hypothetical protein